MNLNWREQLERLDQTEGPAAALDFLAGLASPQSDNFDLLFELAKRYKNAGQHSFAIGSLLAVSRHAEHDLKFRACLDLASCFETMGDFAGASLAFAEAQENDPGSHWPVIGRAKLSADPVATITASYAALRPDAKAEAARFLAGLRAQQAFEAARGETDWRIHPPPHIPALADAVLLMVVKDEEDIIGQNLRHHYALGFRRFCIVDNASTDRTPEILNRFRDSQPDCRVAIITDHITGHYHGGKIIAAERFAEVYMSLEAPRPSWYVCLDADEFISFTGSDITANAAGFTRALADENFNLVVLHWIHCSSTPMYKSIGLDADPFQCFNKIVSRLHPAVPKIGYRARQNLEPMEGNHFVPYYDHDLSRVLHAADFGIYLMHFSLRSVDHVRRKVINGGRAYEAAKNMDIHGGHWRERFRLYQLHGESIFPQILANHINSIK